MIEYLTLAKSQMDIMESNPDMQPTAADYRKNMQELFGVDLINDDFINNLSHWNARIRELEIKQGNIGMEMSKSWVTPVYDGPSEEDQQFQESLNEFMKVWQTTTPK